MLNVIWASMIAVGILYAALTGNLAAVADGALDSAGEAVQLCITMTGVMSFWVGLMEIASSSGLIRSLTRGIQPFVSFLFPRIPQKHPAREYISANFIANILGLGWACTPAGLKAMEELEKLEEDRRNVNVIAYRSQYGSAAPASIVGAGILATAVSTAAAVIFCKAADRS